MINITDSSILEKNVHLIIEKTVSDIRVKEKNFYMGQRAKPIKPNKAEILTFSIRSQKNASFMITSAARDMTTAISLTYPIEIQSELNFDKINRDRDVFIKAYKREYGENVRYVWVKEFQKNGSLHYHFMTDCKALLSVQDWFIRSTWYDVVGSGLIKHFYNGVYCDKIRSQGGYARYLASYLGKLEQKAVPASFGKVGRFWGGSRNAFEVEIERHDYGDYMVGIAHARRYLRPLKKYRASKLKQAGMANGKKYKLKRSGGGFTCWGGRVAYDELQAFYEKQNQVPF